MKTALAIEMKTALAIKARRLGDTVLWTSALQALVDLGYEVDIVYPEMYRALFQEDPRFPRQHAFSNNLKIEKSYDVVLNFHASPTSAKLAKRMKGEILLTHFHSRQPKKGYSTLPIPSLGIPMKATERDLNVLRPLGWSGIAPATKLFLSNERKEPIRKIFDSSPKPWLLLGPEASRPSKEWPLEYYVEVARTLAEKYSVGFLGERTEKIKTDPRYTELQKHATYFPTPTLESLIATLSLAHSYLGSDSGPKHIAAALGVKTFTLFGPESMGEWHCYEGHPTFQVSVACRNLDPERPEFAWCNAEYCPLASHACLRLITPADVVKVL